MKGDRKTDLAAYYESHGVLGEIIDEPVPFALDATLRDDILHGRRKRRLQNVSIKLDAVHVQALRKLATRRAIPYQTLIRQYLADAIRRELRITG
jgi:hypothetical protein